MIRGSVCETVNRTLWTTSKDRFLLYSEFFICEGFISVKFSHNLANFHFRDVIAVLKAIDWTEVCWQGWFQNTSLHVQWAAQHKSKPRIQKSFLAYAPGEKFTVKWLVAMFESGIYFFIIHACRMQSAMPVHRLWMCQKSCLCHALKVCNVYLNALDTVSVRCQAVLLFTSSVLSIIQSCRHLL